MMNKNLKTLALFSLLTAWVLLSSTQAATKDSCFVTADSQAWFGGLVITEYKCFDNDVTIPDEIKWNKITEIWEFVFKDSVITSVKLPSWLKQISDSAFADNIIEKVQIPEGVEIIWDSAFKNNANFLGRRREMEELESKVKQYKEEIEHHLIYDIIPFWKKLRDDTYGGYYGYVSFDLDIDTPSRTIERNTVALPIYWIVFPRMGGRLMSNQNTTRLKTAMTVPGFIIFNKALLPSFTPSAFPSTVSPWV